MPYKNRLVVETLRSLGTASIGANYAAVGTAIANPCIAVNFINATDGDVLVSDDGVNNKYFLPANSFNKYDIDANRLHDTDVLYAKGTTFYAKDGPTPSANGTFYIEVLTVQGDS